MPRPSRIALSLLVFSVSILTSPVLAGGPSAAGEPKGAPVSPPVPAAPGRGAGVAPAGSSKQGATAVALLQRAVKARKAGRWAEAADAYRAVWELEQRPEIAGELGVCEVALGRYREAAEHLQISLDSPAGLSGEQRRRFEAAQERAEREVATVAIGANPTAAEVSVDGQALGEPRETYVIFLDPGLHTFRARLPGYNDEVVTLDAVRGTSPTVSLQLQERPPPPKPSAPPVRCRPGADCGNKVAIMLRYVGFAATGAALVAGAGMAIGAAEVDAVLEDRAAVRGPGGCWGKGTVEPCKNLTELRQTRDMLASGAVLGFMAAGAVGIVTVSSFWWAPGPRTQKDEGIQVAPAVARGQFGALVQGRW